jgi:hypothetical protein
MRARLERAIQRGASGVLTGVAKRVHLGMRPACKLVRAAPDDYPVVSNHDCADHRIGSGATAPSFGEKERTRHVPGIDVGRGRACRYHFSSNNASTYSCGANGIKSSIPSPTPT